MLSFYPPYQIVNGHTLLADHEDEQIRYVLPASPQLALRPDGQVDFSLVQYLGGGLGSKKIAGGLLTFSAELSTDIETLKRELAESMESQLLDDIHLKPVLFDRGVVELVALGESNSQAVDTTEKTLPFEMKILGSSQPTLDGNNRVSFQLLLDAAGAELVEQLLDTPSLPLLLIYRMQLSGLRPSYNITIKADWQKVYNQLSNRLKANAYYAAADVELAVEKALEENNIEVDTTVFGSSETEQKAAVAARRQLLDWVIERMFKPLFSTEPNAGEMVADTVDTVLSSLVRSLVPGVTYQLRSLAQEQIRHFHIRLDESIAERREIVPQGQLGARLRQLQVDEDGQPHPDWPAVRDTLVQKVNLNGFPRLEVLVGVEDRFASDGISRIEVELRQGTDRDGAIKQFTFRQARDRHAYLVNLLGADNPFDLPYQYRSTVHFDPAHPFGDRPPAQTDWQTGRSSQLFVEPRLAYQVESIQVSLPPTFQFQDFAAVTVDLSYGDFSERLVFQDTTPQTWSFRYLDEAERPAYSYQVSYLRSPNSEGKDITLPVRQSTAEILSLSDPAPNKRALQILVNLPLEGVRFALLELRYDDKENGISFSEQIDLLVEQGFISKLYDIAEGGTQKMDYRLTILSDKGLVEGEWRTTQDTRLVVDSGLLENRVVTVRAVGGLPSEHQIKTVRLHLQQRSQDGTIRAEQQLSWDGEIPPHQWEFALGDPPIKDFYAQVTFVDFNGFARREPWQKGNANTAIIHLQQKKIIL